MRTPFIALPSLAVLAAVLSFQAPVAAQTKTFTCGRDFAQLGETKTVVEMKCGRPAATDSFCKKIETPAYNGLPGERPRNRHGVVIVDSCETVDQWTYKPGAGQFVTMLLFREGELVEIKYGPRM